MGTGSDKKGQDKKRIRERNRENCKAGRQTLECKATLVWRRKKERRRLRGKKKMEMAVPGRGKRERQREKRKAKEKVDEFDERRHGKGWSRCGTPSREKPKEEEVYNDASSKSFERAIQFNRQFPNHNFIAFQGDFCNTMS